MPVHDDLSDIQLSVLYGALLGDGCLNIHKNGINAIFSYTSKSHQHTQYIADCFSEYISSKINICTYHDNRTDKEYTSHSFKTLSKDIFTKIYYEWYINGVKHLPKTLVLNNLICLIWYIGDGCICNSKRTQFIKLSTHCFSKEEQEEILIPQLSEFEAKLMKADSCKEQYFIYIPRRKVENFLKYIGDCPFDDYKYKWHYNEYKNKQPKNHISHEEDFCRMYKSGMTYYAIAKEFGIEPNAVKYYLKKNKLYKERSYT